MHLVFDARYVRADFHDGISRYSVELGLALQKIVDVTFLIHDDAQRKWFPEGTRFLMGTHPEDLREPWLPKRINPLKPDVVFSPLQVMGGIGRKYRLVLTLQDLIYHRHRTPPYSLRPLTRLGWYLYHLTYLPQRLMLSRADVVATISETTKAEISQHRLTRRPVVVVSNAPRVLPRSERTQKSSPPANLVYMGSFMPYKGVETLIAGLRLVPDRTLHLLSPISERRRSELEALASGLDVRFHNGVSDDEYARLLADDALLVSATTDEGFGLPPVEALAIGTPSVLTDLPVMREVAGPGAEYFRVSDPADFARAVRRYDSPEVFAERVREGQEHIRKFSWDRSAAALIDALSSDMPGNPIPGPGASTS